MLPASHVPIQRLFVGVRHWTELALEYFGLRVGSHVLLQVGRRSEAFITRSAGKRLFSGVNSGVLFHEFLKSERLAAVFAGEPLLFMHGHMFEQVDSLQERLTAVLAAVLLVGV